MLSRLPAAEIASPSLSTLSSYVRRIFHGVSPRALAPSPRPKIASGFRGDVPLLQRPYLSSVPASSSSPPPPSPSPPPTSDCNLLRDQNRKARQIEGTPVFHYQAGGETSNEAACHKSPSCGKRALLKRTRPSIRARLRLCVAQGGLKIVKKGTFPQLIGSFPASASISAPQTSQTSY